MNDQTNKKILGYKLCNRIFISKIYKKNRNKQKKMWILHTCGGQANRWIAFCHCTLFIFVIRRVGLSTGPTDFLFSVIHQLPVWGRSHHPAKWTPIGRGRGTATICIHCVMVFVRSLSILRLLPIAWIIMENYVHFVVTGCGGFFKYTHAWTHTHTHYYCMFEFLK